MQTKKEIQLSGNIRNPQWMTDKFNNNKLSIRGSHLTEAGFKDLKIAIRIISEVYENKWDIDFDIDSSGTISIKGIVILFPEVIITNRGNNSHLMKDLLVKISLGTRLDRIVINSIYGTRLTLSYAEWQNDYFHSHLSTSRAAIGNERFPYFRDFCRGSGEINIYMADLNGEGFTEERFYRLAVQLLTLVSYESIEGVPYRNMRNVRIRSSSGSFYSINASNLRMFKTDVLYYYKEQNKTPELDIIINSKGLYEIANNEKFTKFLYDVDYGGNHARYFCIADASNNQQRQVYYRMGSTPGYSVPPVVTEKYMFRGEEKPFVIEQPPVLTETDLDPVIHPNLIKNFKKEIEYELNKEKIRKSTIDRYTTKIGNATESTKSNTVPMPSDSQSRVVRDTILQD